MAGVDTSKLTGIVGILKHGQQGSEIYTRASAKDIAELDEFLKGNEIAKNPAKRTATMKQIFGNRARTVFHYGSDS